MSIIDRAKHKIGVDQFNSQVDAVEKQFHEWLKTNDPKLLEAVESLEAQGKSAAKYTFDVTKKYKRFLQEIKK
jgi:hypothetical protein